MTNTTDTSPDAVERLDPETHAHLCDPLQDARVQALVAAARKVNQSYWHESDGIISGIYELETALRALEQGEG